LIDSAPAIAPAACMSCQKAASSPRASAGDAASRRRIRSAPRNSRSISSAKACAWATSAASARPVGLLLRYGRQRQ
jgi:hypothetical protein